MKSEHATLSWRKKQKSLNWKKGKQARAYINGNSFKKCYCIDCGKQLGRSAIWKKNIIRCLLCSRRNYVQVNGSLGGNIGSYKRGYYKKIWMRSGFEISFAKYLDKNKIKWKYEFGRFRLKDGRVYVPDFYLVDTDEYIEIKGWWHPGTKEKFLKFKKEFKKIKIKVLYKKDLKRLGIKLK